MQIGEISAKEDVCMAGNPAGKCGYCAANKSQYLATDRDDSNEFLPKLNLMAQFVYGDSRHYIELNNCRAAKLIFIPIDVSSSSISYSQSSIRQLSLKPYP